MITNYFFMNRELLDEVYDTLGDLLIVTKSRTDAVNFYNEALQRYSNNSGSVMCDHGNLTISSKANRITVRAVRNKEDLDGLRGHYFTKIYAVGFHSDEDFEYFETWLK